MQHEKIIKRTDGTRVKISVTLWVDMRGHFWQKSVVTSAPGKIKFSNISNEGDATPAEIKEVQLELLETLKP